MPIVPPEDLRSLLSPRKRLLGLDLGTKTIGLAIGDSDLTIASPLETIRRKNLHLDCARLEEIIAERDVGGLVIGLPVNMDGSEGERCVETRKFGADLLSRLDLPITFWDERLSTAAVERAMIEADLSRSKRAKVVDKLAAAYILQGALDFLSRS